MSNQYRFILTGSQGEGKTTFAIKLVELLHKVYKIGGILSHGTWQYNKRVSFDIEDIMTGTRELLCDTNPSVDGIPFRHFFFKPSGFIFGKCAINNALAAQADIMIIDEVGPLEMEGKGWAESIEKILNSGCPVAIFIVRRALVEEIADKWSIQKADIVDIDNVNPAEMTVIIEQVL